MTSDNDLKIEAIKTIFGIEVLLYYDFINPILRMSETNFNKLIAEFKRKKKFIEV